LLGHRQHRLGVGILSGLTPAAHLLRKEPPLAAIGTELGTYQGSCPLGVLS
jgi:hypothetical protein